MVRLSDIQGLPRRRPYVYVRLGILECLISISRHILGLRIINGLLRNVGAMEPWRLRGSIFPLRRHKHFVLVLVVHDAL